MLQFEDTSRPSIKCQMLIALDATEITQSISFSKDICGPSTKSLSLGTR